MRPIERFRQSSSFKMALMFSGLLLAVILLVVRSFGLGEVSSWVVISIALFISVFSFLIGIFVVNSVNHIASTASEIMLTGRISARIPVEHSWDDLSKLAIVLNQMLDEIESLVQGVRRVSDNIAHDLRTPLTRLRNSLEEVADEAQREELLAEADNLMSMFNGLLRISDIETDKQRSAFASVRLEEIVEDVIAFYQPLAEEKEIAIYAQLENVSFTGDRDLIFQAAANVVDNAIKFTPDNGRIDVVLSQDGGDIRLEVRDSGVGIKEDERDCVFRRFYRADPSRHLPGHGLGLSLVDAIVKLHGGRIELAANNPGLILRFVLPKI